MQRFLVLFLAVLAIGVVSMPRAAAAKGENGMYAVRDIGVDATADTADAARDKAIAQGARKGLEQLLKDLSSGDSSKLPVVTDKIAGPLVQDFEVESERSSPGRYIARLSFRYKPDGVRALIAESGGHFITSRAPLLLVVPVYRSAAGDLLWQSGNPWRDAWKDADSRAGLVPVVVPSGTPQDLQTFTAADFADPVKLAALADLYHAENAVIVFATAVSPTGDPADGLRLTLSGGGGPDTSFKSDGAPSPTQVLSQGVDTTLAQFDTLWKQHMLKGTPGAIAFTTPVNPQPDTTAVSDSQPPTGNGYALKVPLYSPSQWPTLRTRLAQARGISHVELKSLTRESAIVVVNLPGDEEQLTQALAGAGLSLGPPQAVPADDTQFASMVPASGPGAGLIYPLSTTGAAQ